MLEVQLWNGKVLLSSACARCFSLLCNKFFKSNLFVRIAEDIFHFPELYYMMHTKRGAATLMTSWGAGGSFARLC